MPIGTGTTVVRLRHAGYVRLIVSEDGAAVFYATKNLASRHMEPRGGDGSDDEEDEDGDEDEGEDEEDEGEDDGEDEGEGAHGGHPGAGKPGHHDHHDHSNCDHDHDHDHDHGDEMLPCLQFELGWAPALATIIGSGAAGVRLDRLPRPDGEPLTAMATVVRGLLAADLVDLA